MAIASTIQNANTIKSEVKSSKQCMKLYRIRNWENLFENNRSRELKKLDWVPIPNHHDGENYSAIMADKNGSKIFAAWILMVQVASRCDPRGTLMRGSAMPHNSASLALKTRAPAEWFEISISFLEKHTDWIEHEEVAENPALWCDPDRHNPAPGCLEGKGREGNGKKEYINGLSPLGLRICGWFNRRLTTKWSEKENRALKSVETLKTAEDDLALLDHWFEMKAPYRRHDPITLLNNWNTEIDRARSWKANPQRDAPKISPVAQKKAIEEVLATHHCNKASIRHTGNETLEQRDEYKRLKEQLETVNKQMAMIAYTS